MKKLSISLFALLAIVFAVSSAFTTSKSRLLDPFRIYGVNSTITFNSNPATFSAATIDDEEFLEDFTSLKDLDDYVDEQLGAVTCDVSGAGANRLCLAEIEHDASPAVVAVKPGIFAN